MNQPTTAIRIVDRLPVLLTFLAAILVFSCNKESRKINSLPDSLQSVIQRNNNCDCQPYINKYTWHGQTVYLQAISGPACNGIPRYYNEKGEAIQMAQGYTFDNFVQESKLVEKVWSCK